MSKWYIGGAVIVLAVYYWYRSHKPVAYSNPLQSSNSDIGSIVQQVLTDANGNKVYTSPFARATGPVEAYTSNDRYTAYQNYLSNGTAQALPFESTTATTNGPTFGSLTT